MRSCCRASGPGDFGAALARSEATPSIGTGSVRRIAQLAALLPQRAVLPAFAATSTRGCASWTPATTTRWCSRPPACGASGSTARISATIPLDVLRPGAGPGHRRDRDPIGRRRTSRRWRAINDPATGASLDGRARAGRGARRRLPAAARRDRDARRRAISTCTAVVASPDGRAAIRRARRDRGDPAAWRRLRTLRRGGSAD